MTELDYSVGATTYSPPTCTCVSKSGHWRRLRNGERFWFAAEICGDLAVWSAYNPLTGEQYYCCYRHWTSEAVSAAERMGLVTRSIEDEQDA